MCLRRNRWEYIEGKAIWYKGLPKPNVAEARWLKEEINKLHNLRFSSVSIELDCKQVVDDTSSNNNTNFICLALF